MPEDNKIEIRSGEVQEILGGIPSWIVRYGTIMFVTIVALFIALSFVLNYPDILRSDIIVTTENPPATLVARTSGKIDELFVQDNQRVVRGQVIALIENPAVYADILRLSVVVDSVKPPFDTLPYNSQIAFNKNLNLGEIQEFYSQFLTRYDELLVFQKQDYYRKKNESLREQFKMAEILYNRLWEQKDAVEKEYNIKKRNYERQQRLIAGQVISSADFEKAESEMLSKKSELDGLRSVLAQRQIDIRKLEQEIIENDKTFEDVNNRYKAELTEAYNNLQSAISNWELNYLMRSPIDGVITFNKFWSVNQNVNHGDKVFTVVPGNVGDLIGKVTLKVRGSGKVKPGLNVNVKFENYPYVEYGFVRGEVKNVSLVPEDNFYMVEVIFPHGLITNYGRDLALQTQLMGKAEIITEDLKLIERIFNPLKSLWLERVDS